jgi:hypothetical protein
MRKEYIVKRLVWILAVLLWLTAVSCSPATGEEESPAPAGNDGGLNEAPLVDPDVFPRSTLTPPPVAPETAPGSDAGYPIPQLPPPATLPEGYALPPLTVTINAYPAATGTLIWILKPVGEQCAETPPTPDLQTAVADMVAFGIPVEAFEMADLPVCSACGCPTSAHFRLQIDSGYLDNAEVLGWFAEE